MVLDSVDGVQLPAELSQDPSQVGKEARFELRVDQGSAVFRRVDDVRQKVAIAVWHGVLAMRSPGEMLPRNRRSVARLSGFTTFGNGSKPPARSRGLRILRRLRRRVLNVSPYEFGNYGVDVLSQPSRALHRESRSDRHAANENAAEIGGVS